MTGTADQREAPLYRLLGQLEQVRKSGNGYEAACPLPAHAHGDKHPSLHIAVGLDGRVLVDCKRGCQTADILAALGMQWNDLFEKSRNGNPVRRFRLVGPDGHEVAQHAREDLPDGGKRVWFEHGGKPGLNGTAKADLPLYGLPDLLLADPSAVVIVTEGEKDRQALTDAGLLAVGTVTGAGDTPSAAVLEPLSGHDVWLWPDNDDAGREHMQHIAARLAQQPKWVIWPDAPPKGGAADFFTQGHIADEVSALVQDIPRTPPTPTGPRLDVVRMADVQPEAVRWLWRGRLAYGKPTLLMGDPGLGKSLITHWLAATVSVGGVWPDGGRCEQGTALLFTVEDGLADTVAPRLVAAGANLERVLAVRGVIEADADDANARMFALTEHLSLLDRLVAEHDVRLLVMDPVTAYLGPDVNAHREADVRAVLAPFTMLAERHNLVLVLLMHLNKGTGVTALYRATGSVAFPALARVVLGVAPDPNDDDGKRRLLLPVKMNIGELPSGIGYRIRAATPEGGVPILRAATEEDQPPVLVWDNEPVTMDATSALDHRGSAAELGALADVKRALVQILAQGRILASEGKRQVVDATQCRSDQTIQQARVELGIRSVKDGFSGPWFWEWPAGRISPNAMGESSESSGFLGASENLRRFQEASKIPQASKDSPVDVSGIFDLEEGGAPW